MRWETNRQLGLQAKQSQPYLDSLIKELRQEQYRAMETSPDLLQVQSMLKALTLIEGRVKIHIQDGHKAEKYLTEKGE